MCCRIDRCNNIVNRHLIANAAEYCAHRNVNLFESQPDSRLAIFDDGPSWEYLMAFS
jgi:hypothetical protein